ncbi:hypothetical protein FOL47_002589 [Perkinsus chesapeaki]|uniref:Uncharacterized protein n=1 Tax=Perkinsus chesapeaki TaxID=330153 RepID=A0A7J6MD82_PERCH|nr:hypothetical protein FOL47_002589 [Perkinsus chesapeaki]
MGTAVTTSTTENSNKQLARCTRASIMRILNDMIKERPAQRSARSLVPRLAGQLTDGQLSLVRQDPKWVFGERLRKFAESFADTPSTEGSTLQEYRNYVRTAFPQESAVPLPVLWLRLLERDEQRHLKQTKPSAPGEAAEDRALVKTTRSFGRNSGSIDLKVEEAAGEGKPASSTNQDMQNYQRHKRPTAEENRQAINSQISSLLREYVSRNRNEQEENDQRLRELSLRKLIVASEQAAERRANMMNAAALKAAAKSSAAQAKFEARAATLEAAAKFRRERVMRKMAMKKGRGDAAQVLNEARRLTPVCDTLEQRIARYRREMAERDNESRLKAEAERKAQKRATKAKKDPFGFQRHFGRLDEMDTFVYQSSHTAAKPVCESDIALSMRAMSRDIKK